MQPNNIAGIALTFYEAMHFEEIFAAGSQKSTKIIVPNNKAEKISSVVFLRERLQHARCFNRLDSLQPTKLLKYKVLSVCHKRVSLNPP